MFYFALLGLIGIALCMPILQMAVSYTNSSVAAVLSAPPNSATFRFPITPYKENSRVDSRARSTPVIFSIGFLFLLPVALRTLRKRGKFLDVESMFYFALLGLIGIALCMPILQMAVSYSKIVKARV